MRVLRDAALPPWGSLAQLDFAAPEAPALLEFAADVVCLFVCLTLRKQKWHILRAVLPRPAPAQLPAQCLLYLSPISPGAFAHSAVFQNKYRARQISTLCLGRQKLAKQSTTLTCGQRQAH